MVQVEVKKIPSVMVCCVLLFCCFAVFCCVLRRVAGFTAGCGGLQFCGLIPCLIFTFAIFWASLLLLLLLCYLLCYFCYFQLLSFAFSFLP